jgi:hypothetical protein
MAVRDLTEVREVGAGCSGDLFRGRLAVFFEKR